MGLLDTVVGALAGGGRSGGGPLLEVLAGLLAGGGGAGGAAGGGGLGGLVEQFQRGGLGDIIGSWISTGQNLPISADQLGGVLGSDMLSRIAEQLGVSQGEAATQLSQVLPQMIDRLTPDGRVPEGGLGSIGEILKAFR